jgi:uncharacterized protein (DUF1810 family)
MRAHTVSRQALAAQTHGATEVVKAWTKNLAADNGGLCFQRTGSTCYVSTMAHGVLNETAAQRIHDELLSAALALDEHGDQRVQTAAGRLLQLLVSPQASYKNPKALTSAIRALNDALEGREPAPTRQTHTHKPTPVPGADTTGLLVRTPPAKQPTGNRPPHLQRFLHAQDEGAGGHGDTYANALQQLNVGKKLTHWIWYVFPQPPFGTSPLAKEFAVTSVQQARDIFKDPDLGPRLVSAVEAMLQHQPGKSAADILGSDSDVAKFHSSITLFAQAMPEEPCFQMALKAFFDAQPDAQTLLWLQAQG